MSKTKEVLGSINFGYSTRVILPIEEAHKIQAILARYATGVSSAYRPTEPNISYVEDYSVPSVEVLETPQFDCRGLTPKQKQAWAESVRDSEGDTFLSPQEFVALRGENNE